MGLTIFIYYRCFLRHVLFVIHHSHSILNPKPLLVRIFLRPQLCASLCYRGLLHYSNERGSKLSYYASCSASKFCRLGRRQEGGRGKAVGEDRSQPRRSGFRALKFLHIKAMMALVLDLQHTCCRAVRCGIARGTKLPNYKSPGGCADCHYET